MYYFADIYHYRYTLPGDALAVFAQKDFRRVTEPFTAEEDTPLYEYRTRARQSADPSAPLYPDLLDPRAVQTFIELTHEGYLRHCGDLFGAKIPCVFTDEPRMPNPPWTLCVPGDFGASFGYDITEFLPALFHPGALGEAGLQARIDLYDYASRRFAEVYFGALRSWCRGRGLLSIGHVGGDDNISGSVRHGYGHILRALRALDLPGVDAILRQIFPGEPEVIPYRWGDRVNRIPVCDNNPFPRYAASAAAQTGSRWAFTESCAVYGSGLTCAEIRAVAGFQYARGINLFSIIGTQYDRSDFLMAGERPCFDAEMPGAAGVARLNGMLARMNYLLSLGCRRCDTALYLPIRDIWADDALSAWITACHSAAARALEDCRCDFDLVDDDVLEASEIAAGQGVIAAGAASYRTVVVAGARYIGERALSVLRRFAVSGGKLVWISEDGMLQPPEGAIAAEIGTLRRHIPPTAVILPEDVPVRALRRTLDAGELYFLYNEAAEAVRITLCAETCATPAEADAESGVLRFPEGAEERAGVWRIPMTLEGGESRVILFGIRDPLPCETPKFEHSDARRPLLSLESGFVCRRVRSRVIGESRIETRTYEEPPVPVRLCDWSELFGPDFSGDALYEVQFDCDAETAKRAAFLDLGEVCSVCEATLNGVPLGCRCMPPYAYTVAGLLQPGENQLSIMVSNTMANQYVYTKSFDKWPRSVIGPYHDPALEFEKRSLRSGLFGPVMVCE